MFLCIDWLHCNRCSCAGSSAVWLPCCSARESKGDSIPSSIHFMLVAMSRLNMLFDELTNFIRESSYSAKILEFWLIHCLHGRKRKVYVWWILRVAINFCKFFSWLCLQGLALQDIPPIRFVVMISPAQLRSQQLKHIYEEPIIKCSSLALLGINKF